MEKNFEQLIENIKLTDLQRQDARAKARRVCKCLHELYYPTLEYNGSTKIFIGSYGKHTNIRPARDVDVLFIMPESEFERFDKLGGQDQLLQEIRATLKTEYSTTEKIKASVCVVVLETAEGTHNIELIPAWKQENGSFLAPDTREGGSWQVVDPQSEIENINESNIITEGLTRELIRMVKKWVENCNVPLKSFQVELLLIQFLQHYKKTSYAVLIRDFFEFLLRQKNSQVIMPGTGEIIDIGEDWLSKAESALDRSKRCLQFEGEGKLLSAWRVWVKIFGDDFPQLGVVDADLSDKDEDLIKSLTLTYPAPDEEFLELDPNIIFRLESHDVHIDTQVTIDGWRTKWLSEWLLLGERLPADKKLTFTLRGNIPDHSKILWKVRNFGKEAQSFDQLRGKLFKDDGSKQIIETTKYLGTHYVQCYIIKDDICIARSRILVPITK